MRRDLVPQSDLAVCDALLRAGSKSFALAARILPPRVRTSATVLYAFCRVADDTIDSNPNATESAVEGLRERIERAYAGTPLANAIDRALTVVVAQEKIPLQLLDAFLEGLAWDARSQRYETLDDLYAYAARVAGTVGAMMAVVMGIRAPEALARACDLGVAMQLTNIVRDVGEDAARGRVYLPLAWLREEGIDPDSLLSGPIDPATVASVVKRLLDEARVLYARADAGIAYLPGDCRIAIRAAHLIYAEIGQTVARAQFDCVTRRAVVPTWKKIWLLMRALSARWRQAPAFQESPPFEATRFLVAACLEP